MDRRSRPAGKLSRLIDQSPIEAKNRPGRKLFAVHKNMHSFGFIIGSDTVAKQYFEKLSKDLQDRFQPTEAKAQTTVQTDNSDFEKVNQLKQELVRKEAELRAVKKSYQALIRVNREEMQTDRTPLISKVDAEVETEQAARPLRLRERPMRWESPGVFSSSPLPVTSSVTPDRMGEGGNVFTHPAFRVQRYTKKNPKKQLGDPILGYNALRGLSPGLETHRRERSFAEYGSMVFK